MMIGAWLGSIQIQKRTSCAGMTDRPNCSFPGRAFSARFKCLRRLYSYEYPGLSNIAIFEFLYPQTSSPHERERTKMLINGSEDPTEGQTQGQENIDFSRPAEFADPEHARIPFEAEPAAERSRRPGLKENLRKFWAVLALVTYVFGLGSGYLLWGSQATQEDSSQEQAEHSEMQAMAAQINPKDGYELPATFGDIGPKLIEAGAINLEEFLKIYQEMGNPLSEEQVKILTEGSSAPVVINQNNQHFLLNLFWAFGLANQNQVLTGGPMMQNGKEEVVNFASTGGWTIAARPVAKVRAGITRWRRVPEPEGGSHRSCTPNRRIKMMASQKLGIARPSTAKLVASVSMSEPRLTAAVTPRVIPVGTPSANAPRVRTAV